jgi:hypothetical protein
MAVILPLIPEGPRFLGFHPENCLRETCWAVTRPDTTRQTDTKKIAKRLRKVIIRSFGKREIRYLFQIKNFPMCEGFSRFRHQSIHGPAKQTFFVTGMFNRSFRKGSLI